VDACEYAQNSSENHLVSAVLMSHEREKGRWEALLAPPGAQADSWEGCLSCRRVRQERSYPLIEQVKCQLTIEQIAVK
jgi:hypothetical protein